VKQKVESIDAICRGPLGLTSKIFLVARPYSLLVSWAKLLKSWGCRSHGTEGCGHRARAVAAYLRNKICSFLRSGRISKVS